MTTKPIGLYLHIPFCKKKCNYCDFCSFAQDGVSWREEYVSNLCREIELYKSRNVSIDSIFFGGGTPSLLSISEFSKIVDSIGRSFNIMPSCEFTVEANPGTLTEEKLLGMKELGMNRLSLGLQSINENELKILGRIHSYNDFLDSYKSARRIGINNINVDLMYGIPDQTVESFARTLENIISIEPEHLSLYGLILEEGTSFYDNRDKLNLPDGDTECDMYYLAADIMKKSGFSHYEISNYCKPGYECKHNLKYWHNEEYIGVGMSAYSYFGGVRFGNFSSFDEYSLSYGKKYMYEENVDIKDRAYEYVMLRLRLKEGISLSEYKRLFGVDFLNGREDVINRLAGGGYLVLKNDALSLTERGFYVSNSILNQLI